MGELISSMAMTIQEAPYFFFEDITGGVRAPPE
jgi:hypothetical protein